jgi:hypothetical protein
MYRHFTGIVLRFLEQPFAGWFDRSPLLTLTISACVPPPPPPPYLRHQSPSRPPPGCPIIWVDPSGQAAGKLTTADLVVAINGSNVRGKSSKRAGELVRSSGDVVVLMIERPVIKATGKAVPNALANTHQPLPAPGVPPQSPGTGGATSATPLANDGEESTPRSSGTSARPWSPGWGSARPASPGNDPEMVLSPGNSNSLASLSGGWGKRTMRRTTVVVSIDNCTPIGTGDGVIRMLVTNQLEFDRELIRLNPPKENPKMEASAITDEEDTRSQMVGDASFQRCFRVLVLLSPRAWFTPHVHGVLSVCLVYSPCPWCTLRVPGLLFRAFGLLFRVPGWLSHVLGYYPLPGLLSSVPGSLFRVPDLLFRVPGSLLRAPGLQLFV